MHNINKFTITHADLQRRKQTKKSCTGTLWLVGGGIALVAVAYAFIWTVDLVKWTIESLTIIL